MSSDIASLLAPVSPNNPVGDNLEYEPLFDEIRNARESDPDYLPQDEWTISSPRRADWSRVYSLSKQALSEKSKDVQLACWFVESLCHLQGLAGLITGMDFLSEFVTRFWFQCWPSLEEGVTIRRSRLVRLDRDLSQQLLRQPLLIQEVSSLSGWRQILALEHNISMNSDNRDNRPQKEETMTMVEFNREAARFSSIEISQQAQRVEQLMESLAQFEARYASLSQDDEGSLFVQSRQTLLDIDDFLQRLAQHAIPPADDDVITLFSVDNDVSLPPEAETAPTAATIMNRELTISQMLAIASYFRQTEPSSPVPFLMERAARWANMTLTEWLEEMLTDDSSMREITRVLTGQSSS
ncbi:type VI secretion system protein TssA [Buttiauxella ferragutiae]|uniref:type VI secretion system protein TssA n=1 Tax=Buttiauxella ferragutiae TaxID=82989 RepID=UPI003524A29F